MSNFSNMSTRTKTIALIAVFSALYGVVRLIPLGPMIGLSASFSASDALAPLYGIILGPFTGGISVIIGTFIAAAMGKPLVFLGLDFLPGFVNAVALGFLFRRKWVPVVTLYIIMFSLFVLSPYSLLFVQFPPVIGTLYIPFIWMHLVAFVVLLSPLRSKAISWVESLKIPNLVWGLAILIFIGTMLQHLTGSLVYQAILGQPIGGWTAQDFVGPWNAIFYAYPFERLLIVFISVIVGVPLVRIVKKSILLPEKQTKSLKK